MNSEENLNTDFKDKPSRNTLVYKLSKEIEINLNNEQFGVDSLAKSVGMSRSSLHRKLHKATGCSTSQFMREYRLKRAFEILSHEDITVSEAAYRVGFNSATYFNTCFHKFYGYTPGEVKSKTSRETYVGSELSNNETENILSVNEENRKPNRSKRKKNLLWIGLLLLMTPLALYIYQTNQTENKASLTVENTTKEKSIAVLPFKNWTGNPDLEYISDGMTDAVISRLTKIGALDKVIPFTSTLKFKQTDKTIDEIGSELGVATLLQGNFQISGNQISINLQMLDSRTNEHIWSEKYVREWKSEEIFEMQTEVVEDIADKMNALIAKDELASIKKIPTKSKLAYSYFLQGDFQKNKASELSYSNALTLYKKAIALDSNFVQPYLDMANIYNLGGGVWGFYDEQEAWNKGKVLLEKVLEIEPDNSQAEEELLTGEFFYGWNFKRVEDYYQTILPNSFYDNSPVISLDYAIKTGRPENALKASEYFSSMEPSNVFFPFFKAESLLFLGKKQEAINVLNDADPLYSDNFFYLRESTKLYFYLEDYKKSRIQLNKILNKFSDYPPILMWFNSIYAQMDGASAEAKNYLAALKNEYSKGSSGSPAWFTALYYAYIKDVDKTFEWLQKSYERHEVEMTWLREEPLLAPIRTDLRYKELYDKVGFSDIGLPIKTAF
ncbi:helix-turn-helix domain-containing protein [Psychroserpens sp. Hel_I_66]|uniref:helix-turn-helix domain-containing protein n=1 Tax=Psychroserpens sp. Hel_I_66 TaxID=1250004 RepID=UPI0006469FAB|nr:helix-turn-helix domain-containing protein [Psychroserpens sp. Hel_I_66]